MENTYDTQKIQELLDSFADGTISQADFIQLRDWINESEAHREQARHELELDAALMVQSGKPEIDVDAAIERFHAYIGEKRTMVIPLWGWISAAAALLLLIVLPFAAYRMGSDSVKETFADVRVEAPAGSQLKLTLPDGTKVSLNSGSVISYSQGFGITDRDVALQGEAFFEVKHNNKKPFLVKTHELTVKDLGTTFLLSNYKEDVTAKVELYQGRVSLDNKVTHTDGLSLAPGQCAVINKATGMLTTENVSLTEQEAKAQNKLSFVNMSLADIAKVLSRCYGQTVIVTSNARDIKFFGQFDRQKDNLLDILRSMAETEKIHFTKENGKYVLYQ